MPSSFFGLNIAKSGMSAYNAWLNTTAHNVSNVKTKGYSRQTVNQAATLPFSYGTRYGMVGTGVEAISIDSERDIYYDSKYRTSNTTYGKYNTLTYYMQSIEDYFYEKDSSSGGIANALNNFFKSITNLTTDPSNTTIRTQTVGFAETLTTYIRETANNLRALQEDVNDQIAKTVDKINAYGEEIASLSKQINTLEIYGSKANDLRDRRAVLLDELSELVDIQVVEKEPAGDKGFAQFIVTIDGSKLVDTYDHYTIQYEVPGTKNCQNDFDKLYDLRWSNGSDLDVHGPGLGGKLQGLFQLRDGNNGEVFSGKVTTGTEKVDPTDPNDPTDAVPATITISDVNDLGKSILKLDIPESDGVLHIGSARYQYKSFKVSIGTDGKYTYTFTLKDGVALDPSTVVNKTASISEPVDFRGVPYYMAQLNEFVRTFSYSFNEVQKRGFDLNGKEGEQVFGGIDISHGLNLEFEPDLTKDFNSGIVDTNISNGRVKTSYYRLTAFNTYIDEAVAKDGRLLACADVAGEVGNGKNLELMSALSSDKTMFRQGQPASFLRVLTSTIGVDSGKIREATKNAENIRDFVDNRRLSKAGVDEDEEAQNLIVCQNLLNYQYKVLSVMNEVLDKLINGTAV